MSGSTADQIKQDCLSMLKDTEVGLFAPGIEDNFQGLDLARFNEMRTRFTVFVDRFELAIAQDLIARLNANNPEFKQGIKDLQTELTNIQNSVKFLSLFARVLNVFSRVIGLVKP